MTSTEASAFVTEWARVWRDHDGDAWPDLLHDGCVLHNPMGAVARDELTGYMAGLVAAMPDHRLEALRWGPTDDGVLIEWAMSGTLPGGPIEVTGVDRFTLRDGKAVDGRAYFDPSTMLERMGS